MVRVLNKSEKKVFSIFAIVVFFAVNMSVCFALPEVDQVASGQAEFTYTANSLVIDASDRAIVNFASFDVGANESVRINLPTISSALLSRVVGNGASSILGDLFCNGTLALVNPHGINFGPNANVQAAGLIASTRDITNSNFLSANYLFEKSSQGQSDTLLINEGQNLCHGG